MDTPVTDRSDLRKYRIELPNMADDADLDPYEFRLLAHYKRVGTCIEGLKTTARKCHMSSGKVSKVRQSLSDKKWITLERIPMDAGRYRYSVTVIDRWKENYAKYSQLRKKGMHQPGGPSPHEASPSLQEGGPSSHKTSPSACEAGPSSHEAGPSQDDGKNKPIKNTTVENISIKNQPFKNQPEEHEIETDRSQTKFQEILFDLQRLCMGVPQNAEQMVGTWLEKHPPERILQAIDVARAKRARSPNYVEAVLRNWELDGYPPTREEQVQAIIQARQRTQWRG